MPTAGAPAPSFRAPEYTLGAGDVLTIIDYGVAEGERPLITQEAVAPDGTIVINPVGVVEASGHTLRSLNEIVNRMAEKFALVPEIRISLARARPVTVYVLGSVEQPGLISADTTLFTTNLRETLAAPVGEQENKPTTDSVEYKEVVPKVTRMTVLTAIQLAGGLSDAADVRNIRVTRAGTGETQYANLWKLLVEGESYQDVELRAGDTVFVPHSAMRQDHSLLGFAGDRSKRIRVWGAFKKPGVYELKGEDDIYSVVAKAGGFTETSINGRVILSRLNSDGTVHTRTVQMPSKDLFFTHLPRKDIHDIARTTLQDGDVIIAGESGLKKALPKLSNAALTTFGAILLLYLSRKIKDVNTNAQVSLF